MSIKDSSKEILITNCLNGNIVARFPFSLIDNQETFKNLLYAISTMYLDFGFTIKIQ